MRLLNKYLSMASEGTGRQCRETSLPAGISGYYAKRRISFRAALALLAFSCAHAAVSQATEEQVTGVITAIQQESGDRSGFENFIYLRMSVTWQSVSCSVGYAGYFDSLESPFLAALAMHARKNNLVVKVVVDDQKPKASGICRIINIEQ